MTGRTPRRPRWLGAIGVCLLLGAARADAADGPAEWVVLDPDLQREADRASLRRDGPWVQFTQRWRDRRKLEAEGLVETMAVNCLTGAYGQTQYPATDAAGKPIVEQRTFGELEHAQAFDERLQLKDNATSLGRALIDVGCTCPSPAGKTPGPAEVQAAYERYMAEPLSKTEFELRYLRVDTEAIARSALADLNAGQSFARVFDRYASRADAQSFPHGELGMHPETAWPIADVRRFRQMRVGESSHVPHEGLYGWEIVQLVSQRTVAAPSLAQMQFRLQAYLERAHGCGWAP